MLRVAGGLWLAIVAALAQPAAEVAAQPVGISPIMGRACCQVGEEAGMDQGVAAYWLAAAM